MTPRGFDNRVGKRQDSTSNRLRETEAEKHRACAMGRQRTRFSRKRDSYLRQCQGEDFQRLDAVSCRFCSFPFFLATTNDKQNDLL